MIIKAIGCELDLELRSVFVKVGPFSTFVHLDDVSWSGLLRHPRTSLAGGGTCRTLTSHLWRLSAVTCLEHR